MQRYRNHPHPNPSPLEGEGPKPARPGKRGHDRDATPVVEEGLKPERPKGENPYGNFSPDRAKQARPRPESSSERPRRNEPPARHAPPQRNAPPTRSAPPQRNAPSERNASAAAPNRGAELRLFGVNACLAAFAHRPDDLRKVYLVEARIVAFKQVLAWCVKHRLGYRVVADEDLVKLTQTTHHEGICFEMVRPRELGVAELLRSLPAAPVPSLLLYLDGVGNPHNFGAVLRSAAHFAVAGVILPAGTGLTLSGAACRVAEGGAEALPVARVQTGENLSALLRSHSYTLCATTPHAGVALYQCQLPARVMLIFGAEGEGASREWLGAADQRITISGSGAVESLNIAASVAVTLGEWWRQHGKPRTT